MNIKQQLDKVLMLNIFVAILDEKNMKEKMLNIYN